MKYSQKDNSKRQKLIREEGLESVAIGAPLIKNLKDLKKSLQDAILVELFTIPPYLCALYSIKEGTNEAASRIIRSVVMEEMLHMVMAANILNAIGGTPKIAGDEIKREFPTYPNPLPHSNSTFNINLLKFSKEAINTFLRIEKPAPEGAEPQIDKFGSIGQFYAAIRKALIRLNEEVKSEEGIFTGDRTRQVKSEHFYGSGGKLIAVYSLEDSLDALDEIVGQGEGIDGTINDADDNMFEDDVEFAHYFRFNEIFHERYYQLCDKPHDAPSGAQLAVDWNDVYNMEPNPRMDKYKHDSWLKNKAEAFNITFRDLLKNIHEACNGQQDVLKQGIPLMYQLKEQAVELMKIPSGNGNYTAGPSFEWLP